MDDMQKKDVEPADEEGFEKVVGGSLDRIFGNDGDERDNRHGSKYERTGKGTCNLE